MQIKIFTLLIILFFHSYKSYTQKASLFTLPKESAISDSLSKKIKQRLAEGGVEYFTINGVQFRFQKNIQGNNLYDIQSKEKGSWVTNLSLPMPKETFFLTNDIDLDSYYDLTFTDYKHINIYFFDNKRKRFISQAMQFSYDNALLDSTALIYGVNNHSSNDWDIDIFSIKGHKKTYLYRAKLFLKHNKNNGGFEITSALLYKCKNGDMSDTVLINTFTINKQFSDFSLLGFMKDIAHNKISR